LALTAGLNYDENIKQNQYINMARPEGFEPPTPRFVVWCSIQLSYGRVPRQNVLARRA
jgi:hypothetical protein